MKVEFKIKHETRCMVTKATSDEKRLTAEKNSPSQSLLIYTCNINNQFINILSPFNLYANYICVLTTHR